MIRKLLFILALLCLMASSAWAQSDFTVYATNAAGWDNTYIYYWTDYGDNNWPGTSMELVYTDGSGLKYYKATIPDIARGIVFTDGADSNLKQTENITENVADNAFWRVNVDLKCLAIHEIAQMGDCTDMPFFLSVIDECDDLVNPLLIGHHRILIPLDIRECRCRMGVIQSHTVHTELACGSGYRLCASL